MSTHYNLSREYRLHDRREFIRFFDKPEVFRFPSCLVFRVPNSQNHFRMGITIKSRMSSIIRNKVKRGVREELRKLGPELGTYDYNVVIPKGTIPGLSHVGVLRRNLSEDLPRKMNQKIDPIKVSHK